MAIYDCFTFFNELELLDIRLNILNDYVDKFVLVEAVKTFSNKDKELYYQNNKERFKKFEDKIIHVIVDDFPKTDNAWVIESHQRNAISRGLTQCKDDDTIIISDLDEIPNHKAILRYKNRPGIKAFKQKVFWYYLNNLSTDTWYHAKMCSYKDFKHALDDWNEYSEYLPREGNSGTTASKIRMCKKYKVIKNGGWHFSYLGSAEQIALKIKSFSHQEFNSEEFNSVEKIKERIAAGKELFDRPGKTFKKVKITKRDYPAYIYKNREAFKDYILPDTSLCAKISLWLQTVKGAL